MVYFFSKDTINKNILYFSKDGLTHQQHYPHSLPQTRPFIGTQLIWPVLDLQNMCSPKMLFRAHLMVCCSFLNRRDLRLTHINLGSYLLNHSKMESSRTLIHDGKMYQPYFGSRISPIFACGESRTHMKPPYCCTVQR